MSAPVKFTCPDINKVIHHIREVVDGLDWEEEDGVEELRETIQTASDELDQYTGGTSMNPLEQLRDDNSKLRDWGDDLEKQVDEKDKEIDVMTEKIESLEYQLKEMSEMVEELEKEKEELEEKLESF